MIEFEIKWRSGRFEFPYNQETTKIKVLKLGSGLGLDGCDKWHNALFIEIFLVIMFWYTADKC